MAIKNILYKKDIVINDDLSVRIPTVGEILEYEEELKDKQKLAKG